MLQNYHFEAMSVDALWRLHEEMRVVLAAKLAQQQQEIADRLRDLAEFPASRRIAAPAEAPQKLYRNPRRRSQTWSGSGLRPRWLVFQLAAGRTLHEFLVAADDGATTPGGAEPKPRA
ncbi:MAG: histidinol phosphate phosphatase [Tardiphaga sp.]|nr:histidinol phosphate phosphatase [Tardiphaga sp.]